MSLPPLQFWQVCRGKMISGTRERPQWYEQLVELHAQKLKDGEIAARLGRSRSTVSRVRRQLGLPANAPRGRPRKERCNT